MRRLATLTAALLLSTPAWAARHEVSFEFQGAITSDETLSSVYSTDGLPGFGLRAGGAVLKHPSRFGLTVLAAWARATENAGADTYDDLTEQYAYFSTTIRTDIVTVGGKADYDVAGFFFPYVRVDGGLVVGMSGFSSNGGDEDDPSASRRAALAPVGQFTAGFEFMLPDERWGWPVTAGIFVDAGYQLSGGLAFSDLGEPVSVSGVLIRSGVGLRF